MEKDKESSKTKNKLFPIFQKNFKPPVNPFKSLQLVLDDSPQGVKRLKRSMLGTKETPGMVQTILDAGQKDLGPKFCPDCGLLYSPGDFQDEEEHRKAHSRLENMFTIKTWPNIPILEPCLIGGFITVVNPKTDSKTILNRLKDFIGWMDSELGAGGVETFDKNSSQRMFLYLFPTKRQKVVRILGCVVMEIIDSQKCVAYPLKPSGAVGATGEDEEVKISVGITRLWTDPNYRKQKIATKLCERLRRDSGINAYIVPKSELGILEPSENGRAFMEKYTWDERSQGPVGAIYSYKA